MDVDATPDQRALLDSSMKFADRVYPLTELRKGSYRDAKTAAKYREGAAELGWFAMLAPESLGGGTVSGNGVLDAALIAYKRGQLLQPGAFVTTNVAVFAVASSGNDEQKEKLLSELISGQRSAAWALGAMGVQGSETGVVEAVAGPSGCRLSGNVPLVAEVESDAVLLVTAVDGDGISQFIIPIDTPGVIVRSLKSLDMSRQFSEIRFESVDVSTDQLLGTAGSAADLVSRQLAIACVLIAAESVGAVDHDFSMATQYAKDRIAFGRPIGSFQGIKHQLADASVLLEMSKGITFGAASLLGEGDDYGQQAASMAKAFVGEHAVDIAHTCFQVFGGIGQTWEHDQHLYLRKVTTDAAVFGNAHWHRERLCQLSGI